MPLLAAHNVVTGFGKDLAAGWEKPEEMIGCRKLKKNKKDVLKSYTPLTSSHDDVVKNKKYGDKADSVDCSKHSVSQCLSNRPQSDRTCRSSWVPCV
jgi:hypothetical protein